MIHKYLTHGGGGGIRTPGGVTPTTVFETAPFNHSGTPPMFVRNQSQSVPLYRLSCPDVGYTKDYTRIINF